MKRFRDTWGRRLKPNPNLAVFANPAKGELMGTRVYAVEYQHAEDGDNYRHDFDGDDVSMVALPNGDIRLKRSKAHGPVWEEF